MHTCTCATFVLHADLQSTHTLVRCMLTYKEHTYTHIHTHINTNHTHICTHVYTQVRCMLNYKEPSAGSLDAAAAGNSDMGE